MTTIYFFIGNSEKEVRQHKEDGYLYCIRGDSVNLWGKSLIVSSTVINIDEKEFVVFVESPKIKDL